METSAKIIEISGQKFLYEKSNDYKVGFYSPLPEEIPDNAEFRKLHYFGAFKKFKKCKKRNRYKACSQAFAIYISSEFFEKTGNFDFLDFYRTEQFNYDMIVLVNRTQKMIASPYLV